MQVAEQSTSVNNAEPVLNSTATTVAGTDMEGVNLDPQQVCSCGTSQSNTTANDISFNAADLPVCSSTPRHSDFAEQQLEEDHQTTDPACVTSVSFEQLVPIPHKLRSTSGRKRRVAHAQCLTGSPYKQMLEENSPPSDTQRKKKIELNAKKTTKRKAKAKISPEHTADIDTTPCLFCRIPYNESCVKWFKCNKCSQWVCADCACVGKNVKAFMCGQC